MTGIQARALVVDRSRKYAFNPSAGKHWQGATLFGWLPHLLLLATLLGPGARAGQLPIRLSWGHQTLPKTLFTVRVSANDAVIEGTRSIDFEDDDHLQNSVCRTYAGAGDIDGMGFRLNFPDREVSEIEKPQEIWRYLLDHSDTETMRRLRQDPGYRPDGRSLTVQVGPEGEKGFTLTVDQLLAQRVFWVPDLDIFITAGEQPATFAQHAQELQSWRGQRTLSQVDAGPETTYGDFKNQWEDMGHPSYRNPHAVGPGHIVCVSWDSAIHKFGIDRGAGVWNDYGNPDHFYVSFSFGELGADLSSSWQGQKLFDGLPIISTTLTQGDLQFRIEQFAYPLNGPPPGRPGDLPMLLLEKLTVTNHANVPHTAAFNLIHCREASTNATLILRTNEDTLVWTTSTGGNILLSAEGAGLVSRRATEARGSKWLTNTAEFAVELPAQGSANIVLKLTSPPVPPDEFQKLRNVDYASARSKTIRFWSDWLAQGAQFVVPDAAVNTLFRANLWHALRLPRRHQSPGALDRIDLPYSNFAYDQRGTPWPVNQSVYVDYMLYNLRGYHSVSVEELAAIFANNQEPNGHVGGFANWGVYTPGMVYSVAKHFLLSGDRASFERLLPQTLTAFDWCSHQIEEASRNATAPGLVLAPLNDLSHDARAWAFNQAYLFAGPDQLARALARIQHPRAAEVKAAAQSMATAIQREFARASVRAPLVQLRDHTWIPYVPGDALTPRRLFEIWYPTDVDCGPGHLARLKALDPNGPLATYLLQDHEDNLFYKQRSMANEPVYNQHASAYLWRDEPKRAIRAFYSMLACAFSHSVFEPVEHRWGWGQYFGPPSTDGAWFELYRNMLIQERDDDSLLLCAATPRAWLEHGKQIGVERAPTTFGPISFTLESLASESRIIARLQLNWRNPPKALFFRFRHPTQNPLRSVLLNGQRWTDFDPRKEWVRIPTPNQSRYTIEVCY